MIPRKIKERTFLIKATPLPERVRDAYSHRRGKSSVVMEDESEKNKYETFFEYEDDLANLKPSSEQYAEMLSEDPYVIMEGDPEYEFSDPQKSDTQDESIGIILEQKEIGKDISEKVSDNSAPTYREVVGFEFIQCSHIKKNGERCKRQAPKGKDICSAHKKYVERHSS